MDFQCLGDMESRFIMVNLKVGSKAIIVNSKHHSQHNFQICEIVEIDIKNQLCSVKITETNFTSTMWVGFNELIPILYEKKEDIEKYGNLENLYKLFSEYKGYYDCICKFAEGECNRADKLAKENQSLQCKIDEMQKHIDCMKAEIGELRTRCHESARDNFDNKQYGLLHIVGREELKEDKPVLPHAPIKVAEMLISYFTAESVKYVTLATFNPEQYCDNELERIYDFEINRLRQIAEHLLVYCNAEENLK